MPIPWLSTLKAIPWGNVMEHAPKVLDKARNLIDRQRSQATTSTPAPAETFTPSEIEIHLATARIEIKQLQEKQNSLEGIVTELAQQQALAKPESMAGALAHCFGCKRMVFLSLKSVVQAGERPKR